MGAATERLRRAEEYIRVFEEGWKQDHKHAMECFDFEERLVQAVCVFRIVASVHHTLREFIYRGVTPGDLGYTLDGRELVARWLELVQLEFPAAKLEKLEHEFGSLNGADELRGCIERAHAILNDPAPASQSLAPGVRVWSLTDDEAKQMQTLAKAKPGDPGTLNCDPKPIPAGDASLIR